jgi:hypothetical protein
VIETVLQEILVTLKSIDSKLTGAPVAPKETKKDKAAEAPAPKAEPATTTAPVPAAAPAETKTDAPSEKTGAPQVKREDVGAALINLAETVGRDAAIAILKQFGADPEAPKFGQIKDEKLLEVAAAIVKAAEAGKK